MSAFTKQIIVKATNYGKRARRWYAPLIPPSAQPLAWELVEDVTYLVGSETAPSEAITIPAGYVFNGHNVPLICTLVFPRAHPIYLAAAALHDFLYDDPNWTGTRARADAIYFEALCVLGIPKPYAAAMYAAVRIGGGWHFTKR